MPEFNSQFDPRLMFELSRTDIVGHSTAHDDVRPSDSQYALTTGDYVLVVSSESRLDDSLTAGQIVDPEEYAEEFPDWENRLLNSFLLLKWISMDDGVGEVGWFPRMKLIKISEDRFLEVQGWCSDPEVPIPDQMPEWMHSLYADYTDNMSKTAPDQVPAMAKCPKCDSWRIWMMISHITGVKSKAGKITKDGQEVWVPYNEVDSGCDTRAVIFCDDCGHEFDLDDGQFWIGSSSSISRAFKAHH